MPTLIDHLQSELAAVRAAGTYKPERVITSPQNADITVSSGAHSTWFTALPPLIEMAGRSPI